MAKFLNKFLKTLLLARLWSIFVIFGAKTIFMENSALSCTTSYGFLASCQNLQKSNDTVPRKRPDRRTEGRTKVWTEPISYGIGVFLGFFMARNLSLKICKKLLK